jgi:AraC-like DNA-binding protein
MMELRIRLAKQLLSSSPQSIEQIAYACGFSSSQLFIRAFKKLVNCTPSQFRNASIYPISKS